MSPLATHTSNSHTLTSTTTTNVHLSDLLLLLLPGACAVKALKIESGFICLIALFALVALVPLAVLTVWACAVAAPRGGSASDTSSSAALEPASVPPAAGDAALLTLEESLGSGVHCRKRALQFALQLVIAMLV